MKCGKYILVIAPENYPGKKYRGKYCYEHRLIWWLNTGLMPKDDECIHHKDENTHNNSFKNLELKLWRKHTRDHILARGKTIAVLKCPHCEKIFEREYRNVKSRYGITKGTFCSQRCSGKFSGCGKSKVMTSYKEKKLRENIIRIKKCLGTDRGEHGHGC